MINSHKELITEIKDFCKKFELIEDFKYIKDVDYIVKDSLDSKPRVLLVGLDTMTIDEENYNAKLMYKFVIADYTLYDDDSVINSETDNIFTISALGDFLKHVHDIPIEFADITFSTETDGESTYASAVGSFDFILKRNPSYWKKMESYNQD